jgi:hypothetical protein
MESVGFKEWAAVCEALGGGRQSIILRKGGIAEGRDGFSFKHREFFLFPTWFHEQPQKVTEFLAQTPAENGELLTIKYAATLEVSCVVTSWEVAEALSPLHILKPEVIRERFDYDEAPGLHVAFVRAFRLKPEWCFPNEKKYGGCRSWVKLPDQPNKFTLDPVLGDAEHTTRTKEFRAIVGDAISD